MITIAFVIAAAIGTTLRVIATSDQSATDIPWRTCAVNLVGAFALGLLLGWQPFNPLVLGTAGIGSFTTFSTVAAETATLLDNDQRRRAIVYVLVTVIAGLALAWLGLSIGETQWQPPLP